MNALPCELDVIASGEQARLVLEPRELVEVPPCPSPRRAWVLKHSLQSGHTLEFEGTDYFPWLVWAGATATDKQEAIDGQFYGEGASLDEALFSWAVRNGVKSWIEEIYEAEMAKTSPVSENSRAFSPPVVSHDVAGASLGFDPLGISAEGCSPHCSERAGAR